MDTPLNPYCRLGHNVNHSCRQCLKHTLEHWGIDAHAYDAFALRETSRQRSKTHRQRFYVKGDRDVAHQNRQGKYGITPRQYTNMLAAQKGVCALCHHPETRTLKGTPLSLAVDHDHATGHIRGLLCQRCNHALGFLEQLGMAWMVRAEAYLLSHTPTWTPPIPTPKRQHIPTNPVTHAADYTVAELYNLCLRCYAPSHADYCSDACASGDRTAMKYYHTNRYNNNKSN